jgi:hypothetical protein
MRSGWNCAGVSFALLLAAFSEPGGAQPSAAATVSEPAQTASAASEPQAVPAASVATPGPLEGVWRCKMVGDIPLGTLTFTGGAYVLRNTNSLWEPTPNASDGGGTVTFNENFALPVDGPLKTQFEVTGAFGDRTFINLNNNSGMLFGCRRA